MSIYKYIYKYIDVTHYEKVKTFPTLVPWINIDQFFLKKISVLILT